MARILLVTVPAHGHVHPVLPVASALVAGGAEVVVVGEEPFRGMFERAGAKFRAVGLDDPSFQPHTHDPFWLAEKLMSTAARMLPRLLAEFEDETFDLVVHDGMAVWGRFFAECRELPRVSSVVTFVFDEAMIRENPPRRGARWMKLRGLPRLARFRRLRARLLRQYPITPIEFHEMFSIPGDRTIVYTSRALQPFEERFDETYRFVGPALRAPDPCDDFPWDELEGKSAVLASLGTIVEQRPDLYRTFFRELGGLRDRALLSVGRRNDLATLAPPDESFLVRPWMPQLQLLPRVDAFVTHAGANSVNEALYHGVPMVCLPQTVEQDGVARRVAHLGAGLRLEEPLRSGALRAAMETVLGDPSYAERARELGETLRVAGGAERAAGEILSFIGEGATSPTSS